MIKTINRIKDIFCIGARYYNGELINYFENIFLELEKKKISPENAKQKVTNLFKNNKEIHNEFIFLSKKSEKNLNIISNRFNINSRIRFGIIYVKKNEYEPMHFHDGFISFQIVIRGSCILDECDKIKIDKNLIYYKPYNRIILKEKDVMLNYSKYRNIHGFGSIDEPVYILSIGKYYGFLGKYNFFSKKIKKNNRAYIDIEKQKKISDELYCSPLLNEKDAYQKYNYNKKLL